MGPREGTERIKKIVMTQRDTPFSEGIIVEELLSHFQALQIGEYTRASDPMTTYAALKTYLFCTNITME